jgi:hypothetical protein
MRNTGRIVQPRPLPAVSDSTTTSVRRIAMGSFAALSTSIVEARRGRRDWRRRIEKVAAASVDEITAARRSERSKAQPRPR